MARRKKIKRYNNTGNYANKAPPHPFSVIASLVVVAGLVYLGIVLFPPVYDFVMSMGGPSEASLPPDQPSEPEPASSAASSGVSSKPEPEPEPAKTAEIINAVYMPASSVVAAGEFIESLPDGANAVMVDVKDSQGRVLYRSLNERALKWGAVTEDAFDLEELAALLSGKDLYLVARMQTFSDPICARADRAVNPIKYQDTEMLWLDNYANAGGKPWSNPYVPEVRSYLTELAVELAEMGAAMVVLEGTRFPDDMTGTATFGPDAEGVGRAEILSRFVGEVENRLTPFNTRVAVSFTAVSIGHASRNARYGGNPLDISGSSALIFISPAELSGGYLAEGVFVTRPSANLASTVREVLDYVKTQNSTVNLIPMLVGEAALTSAQIESLKAAAEGACKEYFLYSPTGRYAEQ